MQTNDKLIIGGHEFKSRFILGSGKYSLDLIEAAVKNASVFLDIQHKFGSFSAYVWGFTDG